MPPTRTIFLIACADAARRARGLLRSSAERGPSPVWIDAELPAPIEASADAASPAVFSHAFATARPNRQPFGACDFSDAPGKPACLDMAARGRGCMYIRTESRNPALGVQIVKERCLPCENGAQQLKIPCWNVGAMVGVDEVLECQMSCAHQERLVQPQAVCSDESGFVTVGQCFDKGASSGSKCMFTQFTNEKNGEKKSHCGPCEVSGIGGIPCKGKGAPGPDSDSRVSDCISQCDVICTGPPNCAPTVVPPPALPPPSPGIVTTSTKYDKNEMLNAPIPVAVPTVNPYAAAAAAAEAAKAAGYVVGTPPPTPSFYPVVIYRSPNDYMMTPGPPPSSLGFPVLGLSQQVVSALH